MVEGSLDADRPRAETPALPAGSGAPSDPIEAAYVAAVRRFKVARAVFIASGLCFLFVLTSGLPLPRVVAPPAGALGADAITPASTAAGAAPSTPSPVTTAAVGSTIAAAGVTWDDVEAVPLGTAEALLTSRLPVCHVVSDKAVGDHTERDYSCPGAHAASAARFTVGAGSVVTQRATSNLRGEREAATMTAERFDQLRKGMAEADALAITGPCDLGVDQQVNGGRSASWTCYGANRGFVVVVIEAGTVKELLNSLA